MFATMPFKRIMFFALLFVGFFASSAHGLDLSAGGGISVSTSPYRSYNGGIKAMPLINLNSEHFYVRGLTGGLKVINSGMHEVSIIASYLPWEFDPDDADDWQMRRLDKRYSTVMAGAAYRLTTEYGVFSASLQGDILGNSDGLLGDLSYAYPLTFADKLKITPAVGVRWDSENQVDYYFGVDHGESKHTGLSEYSPHDAFSPYARVGVDFNVYKSLNVYATGQVLLLSDEIKDSPMVNDDAIWSGGTGLRLDF